MAYTLPYVIGMDTLKEASSKPNILTVDDDELMLSNLAAMLADEYSVSAAMPTGDALGVLKSKDFDGIVLDMNLPDLDGIRFLKMLRGVRP